MTRTSVSNGLTLKMLSGNETEVARKDHEVTMRQVHDRTIPKIIESPTAEIRKGPPGEGRS